MTNETIAPAVASTAVGGTRTGVRVAPERLSESIADAIGVPLVYWFFGGFEGEDPAAFPGNHSPHFGPAMAPALDAGHRAALAGLLAYVGR
mgnify:CR=1 FL=1